MAAKRDDDNRKTMESGSNVSFLSPTRRTKEWGGKQKTMFGRREKKQVSASEHSSRGNEHTHIEEDAAKKNKKIEFGKGEFGGDLFFYFVVNKYIKGRMGGFKSQEMGLGGLMHTNGLSKSTKFSAPLFTSQIM